MPKIRPDTAEKRRLRILDAAHKAFNRHGIAVSIEQICAEAGISKGNFYGYFENKDALILAIAQAHRQQIGGMSEVEDIDQLVDLLMGTGPDADAGPSRFELEAWNYSLSYPALRDIFRANLKEIDRSLTQSLPQLATSVGPQPSLRPAEAAQLLRILAVGLIASKSIDEQVDRASVANALRQLIAVMIRPEDTDGR